MQSLTNFWHNFPIYLDDRTEFEENGNTYQYQAAVEKLTPIHERYLNYGNQDH